MNNKKKVQKQSAINKNIKKGTRGKYNKISEEIKREILLTLMTSHDTLSEISKRFQVNKETIRSFYKNQQHTNLYFELEKYLVYKYLHSQELDISQLSKDEISHLVKQDIDHYYKDQNLEQILINIQQKRLKSKQKRKKPVIEFNSKNRRIMKKIVDFIILAGAAAKNNTDLKQIKTKTIQEFQRQFLFQYLTFDLIYSNNFQNTLQYSEQELSLFQESQYSETKQNFIVQRND